MESRSGRAVRRHTNSGRVVKCVLAVRVREASMQGARRRRGLREASERCHEARRRASERRAQSATRHTRTTDAMEGTEKEIRAWSQRRGRERAKEYLSLVLSFACALATWRSVRSRSVCHWAGQFIHSDHSATATICGSACSQASKQCEHVSLLLVPPRLSSYLFVCWMCVTRRLDGRGDSLEKQPAAPPLVALPVSHWTVKK